MLPSDEKEIELVYVMHSYEAHGVLANARVIYDDKTEDYVVCRPAEMLELYPPENPKVKYLTTVRRTGGES